MLAMHVARLYAKTVMVRATPGEKGTWCNATTAPATVSGERVRHMPLGNREGPSHAKTRKSGDLP